MTTTTVIRALHSIFILFRYLSYIHSDQGSSFMSEELHQCLIARGFTSSRTTSFNPQGNGQVEKEKATVWKAVKLALWSKFLPYSCWQEVLPTVLHSIRLLLCTVTNATPHELMFTFSRKSRLETTLPAWLIAPGPVLLRRHVRRRKTDLLVGEVHLLHANSTSAYEASPDSREDTVLIRDLAPSRTEDSTSQTSQEPPSTPPREVGLSTP
ncbi:uncharacterized protein [Narcine bancroftii]|uniref:uncharacterized protein isoform X1 n=1 Tax=Narcine bancroftii TaxID=1343680 RepID=UPI0038321BDB